jgi:mannose-6-phosphate isomerase-like protein (cupin superfamily)
MDREAVLAARLHAHGLHGRRPAGPTAAAAAARVAGLPDTPRGTSREALAARVAGPPDDAALVAVWGPRGAPYVVPADEAAAFTRALLPPDEAAARKRLVSAVAHLDAGGWTGLDAIAAVADAMRAAVDAGPLGRDDLHAALRERLPAELLPWCRGCESHHVHAQLWRVAAGRGDVVRHDDGSRAAAFRAFDLPPGDDAAARAALVGRVLRAHGPLTASQLAAWVGTTTSHATALLAEAGAVPAGRAFAPPGGVADAPPHRGVRLLAPGDPLLDGPDRETLLADRDARRLLWANLARRGAVLHDGEVAGVWRAKAAGRALVVGASPFAGAALPDLEAEALTVAAARGLDCVRIEGSAL